ncbi:putative F-box/LRR-repeat protein [Camellia lanceoleosa]|uniref:F-box/LRR-repeat protein n=1 Tax=Camellia lanceoleosa TaxID=1840588 RepID=A0ACC0HP11_9ERIC|nr:putative F-box/LRR-repeat protein [Camellia lanceoleosa]
MEEQVDRISALPDEVILHILSLMSMKFAIQTGILSNRWRHLWKFNPVLDFPPFPSSSTTEPVVDYGFVNRCLSLHKAPIIRKFTIITVVGDSTSDSFNPDIESWVDFATSKHVRFLEFYWFVKPYCTRLFQLPNSFYDTDSLEQLVMSYVDFNPPPSPPPPFVSLKKLTLFRSQLTDEALEAVMSTCLLLESLALHYCYGLVNVKVSGTALKEFVFYRGNQGEKTTLQVDAPNLVTLTTWRCLNILWLNNSCSLLGANLFDVGNWDLENWDLQKSNVRILLDQLAQVEVLAANDWFLQFVIEEYYRNGKRCTIFKNLKEFYFMGSQLKEEYNMVIFCAFLEDCPLLQKIKIDFRLSCWTGTHKKLPAMDITPFYPHGAIEFIEINPQAGEQLPQVSLLLQLKSIELLYFSGYKYEMELVKLLLEKTSFFKNKCVSTPELPLVPRSCLSEISVHFQKVDNHHSLSAPQKQPFTLPRPTSIEELKTPPFEDLLKSSRATRSKSHKLNGDVNKTLGLLEAAQSFHSKFYVPPTN